MTTIINVQTQDAPEGKVGPDREFMTMLKAVAIIRDIEVTIFLSGRVSMRLYQEDEKSMGEVFFEGRKKSFSLNVKDRQKGELSITRDGEKPSKICLHFRPYDDARTDRGIVWINIPKKKTKRGWITTATFIMRGQEILTVPETYGQIFNDAKTAMCEFLNELK